MKFQLTPCSSTQALIATRGCFIVADFIVVFVTWCSTYDLWKYPRQNNAKASLARLLLRDGTLYFCLLLSLNIVQMILHLRNTFQYFGQFIPYISTIIISRLMLDIRRTRFSVGDTVPSQLSLSADSALEAPHSRSQLSTMIFRAGSVELQRKIREPDVPDLLADDHSEEGLDWDVDESMANADGSSCGREIISAFSGEVSSVRTSHADSFSRIDESSR